MRGNGNEPVAIESCFPWLISGQYDNFEQETFINYYSTDILRFNTATDLNRCLLWK